MNFWATRERYWEKTGGRVVKRCWRGVGAIQIHFGMKGRSCWPDTVGKTKNCVRVTGLCWPASGFRLHSDVLSVKYSTWYSNANVILYEFAV
jgi:hypothetical protein